MISTLLAATLIIAAPGSQAISLDGPWELCRSESKDRPGADAAWSPVEVPSLLNQLDHKPYCWYRRSVEVPGGKAGGHWFLRFEAVRFATEVYWNGRNVGGHFGGWEPFEIDLTAACRPGQRSELLVRVQDVTGVIDQSMEYNKKGGRRFIGQAKDSIMAPVGSQCSRIGIWQPVSLLTRSDVYLEDVFIQTSVRRHELAAQVLVRNLSDKPRRVIVEGAVAAGPALAGQEVLVAPRASSPVTLKTAWANPRLWGPEDPHLYRLTTRLRETGQDRDAVDTRFGFREFWIDGPQMVLNGTPIKFLATAGHPRGELDGEMSKAAALDFFRRIREAGCVAMRLHANVWPRWWYEAADELGMPIVMESALFCWAADYALSRDEFWRNYQEHLRAIVCAHRNHPSIVMISLENEILHCGGERVPTIGHSLAEAGRLVKSLDPTRPILYDADGDPEGVADVFNLHYPLDFNRRNLWPAAGWWMDSGMELASWPKTFWKWDRRKPLYFGEFLHIQHYQEVDPYTTLAGDEAYRGHERAMGLAKAAAWEMQIEAYRAADVSGLCPWTLTECGPFPSDDNPRYLAVKRAYAKNAAFIREYDSRFYAGQQVERTVYLYNDTLHAADLVCRWRLLRGSEAVDSGQRRAKIGPAGKEVFKIVLGMPPADRCTPLSLAIEVRGDGRLLYERSKPLWVYPQQKPDLPAGIRLAIYGKADGGLARWLSQSGARWTVAGDLARLPPCDLLLIAPHALDKLKPSGGVPAIGDATLPRASLAKFVERGGTVIVLEQDSYECGLVPAELDDRGCTVAFTRTRDAQLTRGLVGNDFQFWRGDHLVARKTIKKPVAGRFHALVDSGGPKGLVYLPLAEVADGRGRWLLVQLAIGEKLSAEPVAQVMLENLIRYAARRAEPPKPLGLVQGPAKLSPVLDEIDARYEDLTGRLAGVNFDGLCGLMLDASCPEVARNAEKIHDYVQRGGRVVLRGLDRESLAGLRSLFAEPLVVQRSPAGPLMLAELDPVTEGLTGQELYWYASRKGLTWEDRTPLVHDVCTWTISPAMPKNQPGVTIEAESMQAGDGRLDVGRESVGLSTNGSIRAKAVFGQSGEYAFVLRGRGTAMGGVYPQVTLSIDGRPAGSVYVESSKWGTYNLSAPVEKGTHEVSLAFTNDAYDPVTREDRNVWLDRLDYALLPPVRFKRLLRPAALVKVPCGTGFCLIDEVNWDREPAAGEKASRYVSNLLTNLGCDFRSAMSGVTIGGDKLVAEEKLKIHEGRDGVAYVGTNGTVAARLHFACAGRREISMRAEGTEVDGIYPYVDVLLDGRRIGEFRLNGPGWQVFRIAADVPAGEHRIGLRFTNDLWRPPADRNLKIAWLRVR